jgi:acetylornithine/succinyldiaminopimelate/putrescine aminotransferase
MPLSLQREVEVNAVSPDVELVEPRLTAVLSTAGLDIEYVRAERNTLFHLDEDGNEIPVLDFMGGFGSLMLGHNHPEIVACAKMLLDSQTPIHAQFSPHSQANVLATELNKILHRETGEVEPYFAIFGNSGAEAIEAALKHAEFDRGVRLREIVEEIAEHIEYARQSVRDGAAKLSRQALERVGVGMPEEAAGMPTEGPEGFETLVSALLHENAERTGRAPLFLAPEGAFHGKLVGSVQLTHNATFRTPFKSLAAQTRFVPLDRPEAIRRTVDAEHAVVLDVTVADGLVTLVERPFPLFCALVLEPIQGEGGIHVVDGAFAREMERVCREIDCPVVIDEIQSGMGRTGAFLASSHIGLHGDYYTLAKSLGGGIAKTAVTLIRKSRYRSEFELLHSSTFAKDGFSTQLAIKVLEILEADQGRAYRTAREVGARLTAMLESLRAAFPDVIKEVRGKGLMLGVEFNDQVNATSQGLREIARLGFLGYVISGYLLHEHHIRVFPTGSAVNTLRIEPSILLGDAEIEQLRTALLDVCTLLRDQNSERLIRA